MELHDILASIRHLDLSGNDTTVVRTEDLVLLANQINNLTETIEVLTVAVDAANDRANNYLAQSLEMPTSLGDYLDRRC